MELKNNWYCNHCGTTFRTREELRDHKRSLGIINKRNTDGLVNRLISYDCPFCGKHKDNVRLCAKSAHIKHCIKNPERVPVKSHKLSEAQKKLISENMKKAHKEGRAGCWKSRSKLEHSYPEKWLISVLKDKLNMTEGIDYKTELYFHKQFLDFAWPDKKLCIEIDGAQHKRFEDRIKNDERKNENLKNDGWEILRLDWAYVYHNTQASIKQIIEFLTNGAMD